MMANKKDDGTTFIEIGLVGINAISLGSNFDARISKQEAERLMSTFHALLKFDIMCKEYAQFEQDLVDPTKVLVDPDWIAVDWDDLRYNDTFPTALKTFEIWGRGKTLLDLKPFKKPTKVKTPVKELVIL